MGKDFLPSSSWLCLKPKSWQVIPPSSPSPPVRLPLVKVLKSRLSWLDSLCSSPWSSVFQCLPLLLRLDLAVYFMHMNSPFKVNNEQPVLFKLDKCLSHYPNGNSRDEGGKSGWWESRWGTKSYWVWSSRPSNGGYFSQWTKPILSFTSIEKEKLEPNARSAEQSTMHD